MPLDHPIYAFVERFEARGILGGEVSGIRPYSRQQVADMLGSIRTAIDAGYPISSTEYALIDLYEGEWSTELGREEAKGIGAQRRKR